MKHTEPTGVAVSRARSLAGNRRGAVMLYILTMTGLIAVVTIGVMAVIASEITAGTKQLQAVQVFNIAEAGIHYAMANLQSAGADTYAGGSVPITDAGGTTTLGTATVVVGCLDGSALPCTGAYAAFRRIVSTGTSVVAGPTRTIVAVVEGFPEGTSGYAICGYTTVVVAAGIIIYGDVGSNGTINLTGPVDNYSQIRADPPPPATNNGYYSGNARAVDAVNCSVDCAVQVQGTTTPYAPAPVCPDVTLPAFAPGPDDVTVTTDGWTMDATTGYDWNNIIVESAGTPSGCTGATPFADLRIQTGPAGSTTVVNIRTLTMGRCARLILLGDGAVDLRMGEATGQALHMGQYGRFGMLETDTLDAPAPVAAGRLRVSVQSTATEPNPSAVQIDRASIVAGTFIVPNGEWDADRAVGDTGDIYGAVLAQRVDIDKDLVFQYDPTAVISPAVYSNFSRLRSWKDQ